MPTRRQFVQALTGGVAAVVAVPGCIGPRDPSRLRRDEAMSVTGPLGASQLGIVLPHEHVLVDFIGADQVDRGRYNADEVFKHVLPHLQQVHDLGCETLVEATPAYLGRDPLLLQRLSRTTGLNLLTNTGYYGAGNNKFLPEHAHQETAEQLAQRWLQEWEQGIDGTNVRPGFVKIGVDRGPLSELHLKLVRAAARTHARSGLIVASHTGDGKAAIEQLDLLEQEGIDPSAFIWVHAQNERDGEVHLRAARRGAWIEFDGIHPDRVEREVTRLRFMKENGCLDRVLVSHDAGWYRVGEPDGGSFRPYDTLFTRLVPALLENEWTREEIDRLIQRNPQEAFRIRR